MRFDQVCLHLIFTFFREKLRRANVQFLSAPMKDGTTGTVIVLTTPDAQRTMLAYQVQYTTNVIFQQDILGILKLLLPLLANSMSSINSVDANISVLRFQGTSSTVNYDASLASAVSKTNILVVEGYLFELPDTIKAITKACEKARTNGALVAITASDVSCIERHFDDFW